MRYSRVLTRLALAGVIAGILATAFFSRALWLPWLVPSTTAHKDEGTHDDASVLAGEPTQIKLSAQAQANLRLVVKPLKAETFWRTVMVPGLIVDRPAQSDRGIVSPATGVVAKVYHFPGDTVKPGDPLFTVRLLSETLHLTQSELFKTTEEYKITLEKQKRLAAPAAAGAVAEATLTEIENQLRRFSVAVQAYRTELQTRGLASEQIDGVAQGKFVSEIDIRVPKHSSPEIKAMTSVQANAPAEALDPSYEVQELKVELGHQVQTGQTMCLLSNHQSLYIEGRAFRQESALVEKTAKEGWPLAVDFIEDENSWPTLEQVFTIRHIANTVDPVSRTFAFFVPIMNQSRSFQKDGNTLMLWRFRPGQKVRLHIRIEKLENVFVLPTDAVVRDGPDAYVFRQNGDFFDRKPVRVLFQDERQIVIANDGSVPPGLFVSQNAATQLNRVLKSGSGGGLPPGFHMHADGSIHSNAAHK